MKSIRIVGTGSYLPEKILSNYDLEQMVETDDAWITKRTGISERRIAAPDEAASDMAVVATRKALDMAGMEPEDLDMIILATLTPDMVCPSGANFLEKKLGAINAVSEVAELAGRRLVDDDGLLIRPATGDSGCDIYISTSSAGGGLQMMVAGVIRDLGYETAKAKHVILLRNITSPWGASADVPVRLPMPLA